jgi:hypothetical protein
MPPVVGRDRRRCPKTSAPEETHRRQGREAITSKTTAALFGVADPKSLNVADLHEFVEDNEAIMVSPLVIEENGTKNVG